MVNLNDIRNATNYRYEYFSFFQILFILKNNNNQLFWSLFYVLIVCLQQKWSTCATVLHYSNA